MKNALWNLWYIVFGVGVLIYLFTKLTTVEMILVAAHYLLLILILYSLITGIHSVLEKLDTIVTLLDNRTAQTDEASKK